MHVPDLIEVFIRPLEASEIPYMITGGVASVVYGEPRFTRDIDLVLALKDTNLDGILSAFEGGDFYVPPPEVLRAEATRRRGGHFNIIHRDTALRADVYVLDDEPLHRWGFERRKVISLDQGGVSIAPIEYVILRKLQYYAASASDRHLRDIVLMSRISSDELDRAELLRWVERLDLAEEWGAAESFTV